MSTPFPLEQEAVSERLNSQPMSDPWHGPVKPGFFSGLGYNEENDYMGPSTPILSGIGSAVSKTVAGAAGAASSLYGAEASLSDRLAAAVGLHPDPEQNPFKTLADEMAATQAAAQKNADALLPNAATTGTAFQVVHGLSEGATLAVAGAAAGGLPGAALLTGATEGSGTYQESLQAGLSPGVAAARAGVSGVTSGLGVVIPGGFGSTLATRLLTGAASNVGLGFASRYADHTILESNGYPEMAAQQKIWDTTAVLTDTLLGAAFGGIAHLHGPEAKAVTRAAAEPGMVDAALVSNLAVHDHGAAVGVPVDPAATHAHQDALEVSTQQLLEGKPNDVSQTGVNEAKFAARPVDEAHVAEARAIASEYLPIESLVESTHEAAISDRGTSAAALDTDVSGGAHVTPGDTYNEYAFRASAADRAGTAEVPELPALTKRNTLTPDAREDSILQYLAKHPEGLDSAEAEAQGIDKASFSDPAAMVGIKRAFRKGGISFDHAAEMLHEQGYPVADQEGHYSPNVLVDRISDELGGTPQHSTRNTRAELEAAHEKVQDDAMRASLHEAAPEFAHEDQATQDFTTLAARAHEHDPEAVERILGGGTDETNERELRAILEAGQERQLSEYQVSKGLEVHPQAPNAPGERGPGLAASGRFGEQRAGERGGATDTTPAAGGAGAAGDVAREPGTAGAPSKWNVRERPLWELSADEMDRSAAELRQNSVDELTAIFGDKELAAKYDRLAASNSDRAYAQSQKIFDAATPEQQAALERWETGPGHAVLSPSEIEGYARSVRAVDAKTPEELGENLRYALTKIGDKVNPEEMDAKQMEGYLELKRGFEIARENGWDTRAISETAIRAAARRFSDPADAAYMLKRFLKDAETGTAPAAMQGTQRVAFAAPDASGNAETNSTAGVREPSGLETTVREALTERPGLEVTGDDGKPVRAADLLRQVQEDATREMADFQQAVTAAISCFGRKGA